MKTLSRRGFLAAGGACAAAPVVAPLIPTSAPVAAAGAAEAATYSWTSYGSAIGGFTKAELANFASNLIEHHLSPIRRLRVEKVYDESGLLLPPHVAVRFPKNRTPG